MKTCRVICRHLLLFAVAAGLTPIGLAAEVYRWTDAKGRVHYSQRPPHGQDARQLDVPDSETPVEQPDAAARRARQQRVLDDFDYRRQRKREAKERLQQQKARNAAECEQMKRQWRRLTHAGPIYFKQAEGGRAYLDDSQREAEKDALRPRYQQACGEAP